MRLPEREGRQPELKNSNFKEKVNRKCKHFWLGSGSRKGKSGSRSSKSAVLKRKLIGNISISGSGPAPGKGGPAAGASISGSGPGPGKGGKAAGSENELFERES